MNDDLIAKIIRQVLADPRIQMLLKGQVAPDARPQMLILLHYATDLPALLRQMCELWRDTYDLRVLASDTVERYRPELPEGMEWITLEEAYGICWQRMVLPTCSANTLAKIALGLRDTPITIMAAEGIGRGIPVELCTSQLKFTERTPVAYRRLYQGYLKQVESYGVILRENLSEMNPTLPAGKVACLPVDADGQAETAESNRVISWKHRLMTEKDVLDFPVGCTVMVGTSTIISPLARDMIRKRRIDICREGVSKVDFGTCGR